MAFLLVDDAGKKRIAAALHCRVGVYYQQMRLEGRTSMKYGRVPHPHRRSRPVAHGPSELYWRQINRIRLSPFFQNIPQYIEVPPNLEAKRIISYFSAGLFY
jgi:hypothetical protein